MKHPFISISIEEIQNKIDELDALDTQKTSNEDLRQRCNALMKGYTHITRLITSPYAWRARKNTGSSFFNNISELWYPPKDVVGTFGRLNKPNQSIMYIAASQDSAIHEMRPKIGEKITILRLKLKDKRKYPRVSELGVVDRSKHFNCDTKIRLAEDTVTGKALLSKDSSIHKNRLIRGYLAREFTKIVERGYEHQFKVSATIADILFNMPNMDGIEYPCLAGAVSSYNGAASLGLLPNSADKLYIPDSCWVGEVIDLPTHPDNPFGLLCIGRAESFFSDGTIEWS